MVMLREIIEKLDVLQPTTVVETDSSNYKSNVLELLKYHNDIKRNSLIQGKVLGGIVDFGSSVIDVINTGVFPEVFEQNSRYGLLVSEFIEYANLGESQKIEVFSTLKDYFLLAACEEKRAIVLNPSDFFSRGRLFDLWDAYNRLLN